MKIFFLSALLFFSVNAIAQETPSPQKSIDRIAAMQLQQVKQRVSNLSTGQTDSLQIIFDDFGKELITLKNESGRNKMTAFQTINKRKDKAVKNVLNKEQQKMYEELQDDWKKKMQERKQGGRRRN
jgi:Skp family chaperone for outer membrane proteins